MNRKSDGSSRNLFIGNKLSARRRRAWPRRGGSARDQAPIIVFASKGDDITPPPQALNWIAEVYGDEREIRARGQKIFYIVHEKSAISASSSRPSRAKEHDRIVTTLETIEALTPGLYEMIIDEHIEDGSGERFLVSFAERKMSDLATYDDKRDDEQHFAAVSRLSELGAQFYDRNLRPLVRSAVPAEVSASLRKNHPARVRRRVFADTNPVMTMVRDAAKQIEQKRKPANSTNPFLAGEKILANSIIQMFDSGATFAMRRWNWASSAFTARRSCIASAPRRAIIARNWTPSLSRICLKSKPYLSASTSAAMPWR